MRNRLLSTAMVLGLGVLAGCSYIERPVCFAGEAFAVDAECADTGTGADHDDNFGGSGSAGPSGGNGSGGGGDSGDSDDGGNPGLGNPGNDKDVGKAGESPNGRDFGNGVRGRSDIAPGRSGRGNDHGNRGRS